MTAGLWAGSTSLTADFATVIWRMQLLGFNTIRLPFSFQARPSSARFSAHIGALLRCFTFQDYCRRLCVLASGRAEQRLASLALDLRSFQHRAGLLHVRLHARQHSAVRNSVVPPGITVPAGIEPPSHGSPICSDSCILLAPSIGTLAL